MGVQTRARMSDFRRGDFVFVPPAEPGAPREVRGLAGTVKKVRGDRATVVWRNDGRESHDVTGTDDWHSGPIEAPVTYRHTFGFAGAFTYRCSLHLDMQGTIVVVP